MRKSLIVLFILIIVLMPVSVYATGTTTDNSVTNDYTIDSYSVNVVVNENNTFDITEKIEAYFNVPKHGIFRKIPLRNEVIRLDGKKSYNRAKITNVKVSEESEIYTQNGHRVVKIGDANKTITGKKTYTITYNYDIGKDTGKDYDELYLDLIGTEWDTTIETVDFKIVMPKSFDKTKLGFSAGSQGTIGTNNVTYSVNGNVITGYYTKTLKAGEGITVRLELPEGYFVGARSNFDFMAVLALVVPIIFVIICFIMWLKYGKDDKVIETVEFYPPEGFNSAEVGFLYNGKAENRDVISLLIYLANKGYIKISETEETGLVFKKRGFKIIKVKEYDGNDVNEKSFFKGLFKKESTNEVTAKDLYDKFYITLKKIKRNLNKKGNKNKIFVKESFGRGLSIVLMIFLTCLLITIKPAFEYNGSGLLITALVFIGISLLAVIIFIENKMGEKNLSIILYGGGFFTVVPLMAMALPVILIDTVYLVTCIIGIISIIGMVIFMKLMPRRNAYGNEILGKIKGFKNFLEIAEKDKLEALVMDDPEYFYNILPYTYVLGISDKWIKKFETISLQSPNWYDGTETFSMVTFGSFMNSTMTSASSAMSSSPSSSDSGSGGGFSGGGSSGGGSGGGGGGSW
jgi:uncharacterized membrane protein